MLYHIAILIFLCICVYNLIGWIQSARGIVCYNLLLLFVPGMFFQFMMCLGIFLMGMIVQMIQGFQGMYPLVLISGFLWTTGFIVSLSHSISLEQNAFYEV